jgi:manganese-transporting P-type ATPase
MLWMLDDYWYYSAMTLAMLVFLEVTVIKQRIRNATALSSMRRQATVIPVYRDVRAVAMAWAVLSSRQLLGCCSL